MFLSIICIEEFQSVHILMEEFVWHTFFMLKFVVTNYFTISLHFFLHIIQN